MLKEAVKEQLKVPAHIDYLKDLRNFVTQIGRKHNFSDKIINAFKLSVDEAATNIIRHAYREKQGLITIRAIVKKDSLTIALVDQGTYFDPQRVKDPDLQRYVDIGKKGGLGIFIMRKLMDEIDYRKTEEGNELRMTKYRPAGEKKRWYSFFTPHALSLKAKYFFRTVFVITLLIIGGYLFYFFRADDKIINDFIEQGQTYTRQLINRLSRINLDVTTLDAALVPYYEEVKGQIYKISIEHNTGEIISSSIVEEITSRFSRPADAENVDSGIYKYKLPNGVGVYEFEVPVFVKNTGELFGKAHIFLASEPIEKQIRAIRLNNLRLSLLILLFSYAGVAVLIYIVMNPFRKLADWVKALGQEQGELEDELDIDSSTEIGEIAQAFSEITHKFRESQKNLADQERLQKEMQVAQEIQQTLLPMEFPELEGYEIASYYEAAKEVGGDYYDFVEVDRDTLGIAVADVSGKGVPGSLVMTMIRTALRTEARGIKDAAVVLARVNEFVKNDMKKGMFVTIFYLIIDSKKRRLNFASAGHNPMILYRGSSKKTYYLNPKGFPIGIQLPQSNLFTDYIESDTIQLAEDDILLIYTDGITEAMNSKRELYGEERLLKVVREFGHLPVKDFVEKLKEDIYSFTEGQPQYDDITLVAIKEKSSREKDELRRAKQVFQLTENGKSIREACEIAGITTYSYYNKYKRIFEEEGVDAFEIDKEVSVEAKHLSIEEKTKIFDIIQRHPEYGAGRISEELNTERYGYTKISESKIYEELVRSRLNTRQLREAYVAKSKKGRRRLKPPGTPLLALDGQIIIDRKELVEPDEESVESADLEKEKPQSPVSDEVKREPETKEIPDKNVDKTSSEISLDEDVTQDSQKTPEDMEPLLGVSLDELLSGGLEDNVETPPVEPKTKEDKRVEKEDQAVPADQEIDTATPIDSIEMEESSEAEIEIDKIFNFEESLTIDEESIEKDESILKTEEKEEQTEPEEPIRDTEGEPESVEMEDAQEAEIEIDKIFSFEDNLSVEEESVDQGTQQDEISIEIEGDTPSTDQAKETGVTTDSIELEEEENNDAEIELDKVISFDETPVEEEKPVSEETEEEVPLDLKNDVEIDLSLDGLFETENIKESISFEEKEIVTDEDFNGRTATTKDFDQDHKEKETLDEKEDLFESNVVKVEKEDLTVSSDADLSEERVIDDSEEDLEDKIISQLLEEEKETEESKDDFEEESFADLIQTIDEQINYNLITENNKDRDDESPKIVEIEETTDHQQQDQTDELEESADLGNREMMLIQGIRYYKNKQYDLAIEEFKKVINSFPDYKEAYSILGNAYFRNQMYDEAVRSYEKVKQLDPNDVTAYENTGVIYANRGQYKKAIEEWKHVLLIDPEREDIKEKIKKIMKLI
ncbi:MAG: tetratricopeptide repeat protein [Calditrichaeota bacterium]|nr:MAG: tetratricopeptide repeat protein [Calditrichota bacterium]